MEITIKINDPIEEELLSLFKSLSIDGQAEVLATAYKQKMRELDNEENAKGRGDYPF